MANGTSRAALLSALIDLECVIWARGLLVHRVFPDLARGARGLAPPPPEYADLVPAVAEILAMAEKIGACVMPANHLSDREFPPQIWARWHDVADRVAQLMGQPVPARTAAARRAYPLCFRVIGSMRHWQIFIAESEAAKRAARQRTAARRPAQAPGPAPAPRRAPRVSFPRPH